jgi:hypothetical protein
MSCDSLLQMVAALMQEDAVGAKARLALGPIVYLAFILALPAEANYSQRTRHMCWDVGYPAREQLANRGDPDAIYCSAVWNAAAYVDETKPLQARQRHRAIALERYEEALALGYDFNRIIMFGMTFEQLILDGDQLTRNGGYRHRGNVSPGRGQGISPMGVPCTIPHAAQGLC